MLFSPGLSVNVSDGSLDPVDASDRAACWPGHPDKSLVRLLRIMLSQPGAIFTVDLVIQIARPHEISVRLLTSPSFTPSCILFVRVTHGRLGTFPVHDGRDFQVRSYPAPFPCDIRKSGALACITSNSSRSCLLLSLCHRSSCRIFGNVR